MRSTASGESSAPLRCNSSSSPKSLPTSSVSARRPGHGDLVAADVNVRGELPLDDVQQLVPGPEQADHGMAVRNDDADLEACRAGSRCVCLSIHCSRCRERPWAIFCGWPPCLRRAPHAGQPGGQVIGRPPSTCACTCPTVCPPSCAGVEDDPVAGRLDALGDGDSRGPADEFVEQPVTRGRQRRHVRVVIPGDHQDVRRRLRVDVTEGEVRFPSSTIVAGICPAAIPQNKQSGTSTIIVARR